MIIKKLEGTWNNGNLMYRISKNEKGMYHGIWIQWYPDGSSRSNSFYSNNIKEGEMIDFGLCLIYKNKF